MEEELSTQELELQNQIETYKAQFLLVESNSDGGESGEVEQLLSDLKQLIQLTEENLVEVKKQKLLCFLQPTPSEIVDEEEKESTAALSTSVKETVKEEEEDDLVGMRCSAPLKESWESEEKYHNAVILCRETATPSTTTMTSEPSVLRNECVVRVLFSQPLYASMLPCSYFMEGSCRYSGDLCKYSHGHLVPRSKLRPVQEPNYDLLRVGGKCLARSVEDDIWYSAILSCIDEECEVYFPSLSRTMQVSIEHIFPLECSSEESSSDSELGEEEEGEELLVEWRPQETTSAFGQWEQHTKGIGSKLLSKMGYVAGQGLGRLSQGRVEPVEIIVLPAGKSLDVCAALREAERVRKMDATDEVGGRKRRRRKKKKGNSTSKENDGQDKKPPTDMFDFLNTKIFQRDKKVGVATSDPPSTSASTSASINVKLFKIEEERKSVKKRRQSLQQAVLRHQKRKDKSLESQTREKLAEVESRLEQLEREESRLQGTLRTKQQQKKLVIF